MTPAGDHAGPQATPEPEILFGDRPEEDRCHEDDAGGGHPAEADEKQCLQVTVEKGGLWAGTIRSKHVVVAGTVEGDIFAEGRVEISPTARITGTVSAEAIAVAEGAVVEGVMRTTGKDEPTGFVEKRTTP